MANRVERVAAWLTVALAAVGLLLAMRQVLRLPEQRDFDAYYTAARAANAGLSLYHPVPDSIMGPGSLPAPHREYVYPPLLAAALRPLAALPYRPASVAWLLLNVALTGVLWTLLLRLSVAARQRAGWALAAVVLLPATYITVIEGQVSILLGVLLLYSAVHAFRLERKSDVKAGIALGLAGAIKVYPVVLIPIFALHRRWRLVGVTMATGIVTTLVGVALAGGIDDGLYWFTHVLRAVAERPWPGNQSVGAVLGRLAPTPPLEGVWTGTHHETLVLRAFLPSAEGAAQLARVLQGLILLLTAYVIWRRRDFGRRGTLARDLALGVALMSLIVPVVWDHYYLQLLIPAALLADDAVRDALSRRLLIAAALLVILQRFWRQLVLHVDQSGLVLACGLLGVMLLWLALLRLRARDESAHDGLTPGAT